MNAQAAEQAYTVRQGDTLVSICARQSVPCDWRAVRDRNRVPKQDLLIPGQVLWLPARPAVPALPEPAAPVNQPLTAEVVHRYGVVSVVRANTGVVEPLLNGMLLALGDLLKTGPASSATLRLPDGSRLVLHADSHLSITQHWRRASDGVQETQLQLHQGSVDTQVPPPQPGQAKPELHIRTPVANLGVRGTQWRTRLDKTRTQVEVLQGGVQAQTAGAASANAFEAARATPSQATQEGPAPVLVGAGFGLSASPEGLGALQALPPAPNLQGLPQVLPQWPSSFALPSPAPAHAWRARIVLPQQPEQVLFDQRFAVPIFDWGQTESAPQGSSVSTGAPIVAQATSWVERQPLPDGHYWLLVRAITANGLEGPDALHAFQVQRLPPTPVLLSPRHDETLALGIQALYWRLAPASQGQAGACTVQVAHDLQFADLVSQRRSQELSAGEGQLVLNLPAGTYHWRVACALWGAAAPQASGRDAGPPSAWATGRFTVAP